MVRNDKIVFKTPSRLGVEGDKCTRKQKETKEHFPISWDQDDKVELQKLDLITLLVLFPKTQLFQTKAGQIACVT